MTSSISIDIVLSTPHGRKKFLKNVTGSCTSYDPNFGLNVASSKSASDGNIVQHNKIPVNNILGKMHKVNSNNKSFKAASNASFMSSVNSF